MAKAVIAVLDAKEWLATVKSYITSRKEMQIAAAEVRRLDASTKVMKTSIFEVMGKHRTAECANFVLTRQYGGYIAPTLTLANGRIVPLSEIRQITLTDGKKVKPEDVVKIYSGRDENDKLVVIPK